MEVVSVHGRTYTHAHTLTYNKHAPSYTKKLCVACTHEPSHARTPPRTPRLGKVLDMDKTLEDNQVPVTTGLVPPGVDPAVELHLHFNDDLTVG